MPDPASESHDGGNGHEPADEPESSEFVARPAGDRDRVALPSAENRDHIREAIAAIVHDGKSLRDAAAAFDVDPDSLFIWHRRYTSFVNKQVLTNGSTIENRGGKSAAAGVIGSAAIPERLPIDADLDRKFNLNWERMIELTERERPALSPMRKWLLTSPLTRWLYRDEKLDPLALSGTLAVLILSFMAVRMASGHRGEEEVEKEEPTAPVGDIATQLSEKREGDVIPRVAEALQRFVKIDNWKDRLPFVRDRERVARLMEIYYSEHKDGPMPRMVIHSKVNFLKRSDKHFAIVTARETDEQGLPKSTQSIPFILEITDGDPEFLIDWEILVNYEPMPWKKFVATKSALPHPFRVRISTGDYYNEPFLDNEKYSSYKFVRLGTADSNYAFVLRGSALQLEIESYLKKQLAGNRAMVLNLRYPNGAKFDDIFEIDSLVSDGWLGE